MSALMSVDQAMRAAAGAGAATLVIGGALAIAPGRVGPIGGFVKPAGARAIGIADLALVPGLLVGRPRWPWMAARAALNVAIVAYGRKLERGGAPRIGLTTRVLSTITVADCAAAVVLMRSGS